jgi:hypothetical protein
MRYGAKAWRCFVGTGNRRKGFKTPPQGEKGKKIF